MHVVYFEGERASNYDDNIPRWVPNYYFVQQSIPAILKAYLPVDEVRKLLVVGCGTGQEISELRQHPTSWQITGLDPSPQMIRLAQMKLAFRENDRSLRLKIGVVQNLPPDELYDAATLILVLHFIPDSRDGKLDLLKNIAARLQKGAPLIIYDIYEVAQFEQQLSYFRQYLLLRGMDTDILEEGLQHVREDTHRLTQEQLSTLLQEAGFEPPVMFSNAFYYGGWVTTKC
ncbi:MAG: class I SAM-dependent methyltransferase [Cyclobacteriaceae bacterium]